MINNSKTLFVKDGDDILIQRSNNQTDGFRTSVYKHFESNMHVVVCRTPSPIYTLNIYVPTASTDDKGLPHMLEHLVFCGSKHYPARGYLDVLAAHNFSTGTNAWTTNDNTCYTLDAASEDAVANVLPVFLDHILNPLLLDDHFVTEVYHYDEMGKEQGVVFSEMGSRENKESTLAHYHLKKLMYKPGTIYSTYSGGKTYEIANLTNKEIIDYHHKYYDANNITVVLTGAFSNDFEEKYLQTIPADIVQSHGCDSREPMDCSPPSGDGHPIHDVVKFPSADTSSGSFGFGWHGPDREDVEANIALEIMMEYLAGTPSSPLNLYFVACSTPLASSILTYPNSYIPRMLKLTFNGVPYLHSSNQAVSHPEDNLANKRYKQDAHISHLFEENCYKRLLLDELERIYQTQFDCNLDALENAAQRVSNRVAKDLETSPGTALQELFCPNIVASHFSPKSRGKFNIGLHAKQFDIIADLGKRPVEFWLDLLKKWLIDQTMYYVAMVPDLELGSKIEAKRKAIEQANMAKIVDKKAHIGHIKRAIEASKVNVPKNMKEAIPVPDLSKTSILLHTQNLVVLDNNIGPVSAVQTINAESEFVKAQIQIPMGNIPSNLQKYLTLFQELIYGTDVVLPAGVVYGNGTTPLQTSKRISFAEFERNLSRLVTSHYSCVGQKPKPFACNWIDSMFVIEFIAPYKDYPLALRWMVQGLLFSDFTLDRILTCSQNILTGFAQMKRDTECLLFNSGTYLAGTQSVNGTLSNMHHMTFFTQEGLLKKIAENARAGKVNEIIRVLKDIQRILVQATGGFMALSLPSNEEPKPYIDMLENEWTMCYGKYSEHNKKLSTAVDAKVIKWSPFPMDYKSMFPTLEKPLLIHVPVPSLETSEASFSFKLDIPFCPTGKRSFDDELADLISLDYFALRMLADLMGRMDGPLDNAVRGKGYSYGAYIYTLLWSKRLELSIGLSANIVKAVDAIRQLLLDMQDNWDLYISETDVSLARSVVVYSIMQAQETPMKMLDQSISNSIHGFANADEYNTWCSTHIAAVKMSDMRRVFEKYVLRFADNNYPMFRIIVTPSVTTIPAKIGSYQRMSLEEISATYNLGY